MLLILTGIYVGLIWLIFFQFKLLPWNKISRNTSILVGVVGLLVVIIGLVQGSPSASGGIQISAKVVGLSSRVPGFITKVHAEPYQTLKKGDPIFEVDRAPYEATVKQLEAKLAETINAVEQLDASYAAAQADVRAVEGQIEVAKASVKSAKAGVESAEASLAAAKSQLDVANADIKRRESDVKTAQLQIPRIRDLVAKKVESQSTLDSAENKVVAANASLEAAKATAVRTQNDVEVRTAGVKSAKANEEQAQESLESLQAQLDKAKAAERKAKLQVESTVDGEHTSIRQVKEQLAVAKYDLENTIVRAPSNGYVVALVLNEGFYVRVMQVGTFVSTDEMWAMATFDQTTVQYIKPGQKAELALMSMPGRIVPAEVEHIAWAAGEAQFSASGNIPSVQSMAPTNRIVVKFKLLEHEGFKPEFAASGTVAVYTDRAKPIGVIRKIVLRMTSLMYWLG